MCPTHIIKQNYTRMMEKVPTHGNTPSTSTKSSDPLIPNKEARRMFFRIPQEEPYR